MERLHRPVMPNEVIEFISLKPGGVYADFTFGEGGHSGMLLERGVGRLIALDRDSEALGIYRAGGKHRDDPRLQLHHCAFSEAASVIAPGSLDGIVVDLGVSTRQLLKEERGFSFSKPGPLDMRMDTTRLRPLSEWLSELTAGELASELERNADLRKALPLAKDLVEQHRRGRIQTTADLAQVAGSRTGKRHPATVIFLALRMLVNDEMGEIERGLPAAVELLKPGGRLVVISFHSSEDRVVKRITKQLSSEGITRLILKKPLVPTRDEQRDNPRSRSAKLRCVEKIDENA